MGIAVLALTAPTTFGYTRPVSPLSDPTDLAVAPNGSGLFASRGTAGSGLTRLGVADFLSYVPTDVAVPAQVAVAYTPNSSLIFGLTANGDITKVYGSTNFPDTPVTTPLSNGVDIAVSPDGAYVYALSGPYPATSTLVEMRVSNRTVRTVTTTLPSQATALVIGADGSAYVTHATDNTLVKVDLANGTQTPLTVPGGSVSPGGTDIAIDPTGAFAYVGGTQGVISKVRLADFTVADQSVDLDGDETDPGLGRIEGVTSSPDGRFVFAVIASNAGFGSTTFVALDAATLDPVRTLTLASANQSPNAIAAADGYAFVSLPGSGQGGVMRITLQPDAPTELVGTAGDGSAHVAFRSDEEQLRNLEYSLDGGGWTALSPATTTSPVTIPGLENGRRYSIRLRVVDGLAASDASDAITVTPVATPRSETTSASTPRSDSSLRTSRPRISRTAIISSLSAAGPGTAVQTGTVATGGRDGRAKAVRACSTRVRVKRAGTVTLTCGLTRQAKALRRRGPITVTLVTSFTPTGGAKVTGTRTVVLQRVR